ncbi:RNA polymerase sigma factor [Kordia sp. YSTF-M3]|uniref:RNA polymerase sigma factor n=1 Tax=Kordia aestuariivivens TaxID=2759037 RepID=A0ABR7QGV6_9FLAO|nr:RNA polymerase sigma factor [Kordia aestuariivivens]MBC8757596.1 RNA polymerase sigma factor [Kordia aestuariivivens]
MSNDAYFIEGLRSGKETVLQEIYDQFFSKVKTFVLQNKGTITDAEDVFHNALIQLYIRLKNRQLVIKSSFEAYLFTTCKNLWRRELNKKRVTKSNVVELEDKETENAYALLEQEQWELYIEKFQLLSENCRKVLTLLFGGTSYEEIVETFSYASKVVARQRVFKCKAKLTKLIKEDTKFSKIKKL